MTTPTEAEGFSGDPRRGEPDGPYPESVSGGLRRHARFDSLRQVSDQRCDEGGHITFAVRDDAFGEAVG